MDNRLSKILLTNLITKYDVLRSNLIKNGYQKIKGALFFHEYPKIEDNIEDISDSLQMILSEIKTIENIISRKIDESEWQYLLLILKNHNERLSCSEQTNSPLAAVYALIFASLTILGALITPFLYLILPLVFWAGIQTFSTHIKERHTLSRNRELIILIEWYLTIP